MKTSTASVARSIVIFAMAMIAINVPSTAKAQAGPAGQPVIDQWVSYAINADVKRLESAGKYTCKDAVGLHPGLSASDDDFKFAQTKYILKCLRAECEQLDGKVANAIQELSKLSDQELIDFMYSQQMPQEKIDAAIAKRKEIASGKALIRDKITCANTSPLGRQSVFLNCTAIPLECSKN